MVTLTEKSIAEVKGIQSQAVEMIRGMERLPYEESEKFGPVRIEGRQTMGNMIKVRYTELYVKGTLVVMYTFSHYTGITGSIQLQESIKHLYD